MVKKQREGGGQCKFFLLVDQKNRKPRPERGNSSIFASPCFWVGKFWGRRRRESSEIGRHRKTLKKEGGQMNAGGK